MPSPLDANVAAVPSDQLGLSRAADQPLAGWLHRVFQRLALGSYRNARGPVGRPADGRNRDRPPSERPRPVARSRRVGGVLPGQSPPAGTARWGDTGRRRTLNGEIEIRP